MRVPGTTERAKARAKPKPKAKDRVPPGRVPSAPHSASARLGIILIIAAAAVIVAAPLAYDPFSGAAAADPRAPLPAAEFTDASGARRSTAEFAGRVVLMQFFYPVHDLTVTPSSTSPVYFTDATKKELDAFAELAREYPAAEGGGTRAEGRAAGKVSLLTVIVPRICCTRREIPSYFSGPGYYNYDLANVTWDLTNDGDYALLRAYGSHIKRTSFDVSKIGIGLVDSPLADDPMLLLTDTEFRLISVMNGYVDAEGLRLRIDTILGGAADSLPPPPAAARPDVLGLLGLLALFGLVSMVSPCCLGMAVGQVSSVVSLQRGALPAGRAGALLIGLGFSMGMGLVFFVLGAAAASAGFFLPTGLLLALTAATLVLMSIAALGLHRRALGWIRERRARSGAAVPREAHRHGPGDGCPHCAAQAPKPEKEGPAPPGRAPVRRRAGRDGVSDDRAPGGVAPGPRVSSARPVPRPSRPPRRVGLASMGAGALFGVVGIPCAAVFIVPAIVLVASREIPLLAGGALMFAFGFARGLPTVPLSLGAQAIGRSRGRAAAFLLKRRRLLTAIHAALLASIGIYTGVLAWNALA